MMCRRLMVFALVFSCALIAHADPTPTYYDGFDNGKIDGPVGKAGASARFDPQGILNMDRGTIAFFYQSKDAPREREWGGIGGMTTNFDQGYWSMGIMFQTRRQQTLFNFFDAGAYSPPMVLPNVFGRWQAGQWHHLAAVWDRNEGIRYYEDGKEVFSNWDEYHWQWNLLPERFSLAGPLDEVYVFAEPLTATQVAQLAAGNKASGNAIAITPDAQRRGRDMARMGWVGQSLANMPTVTPGSPISLDFARVKGAVDAKRPVAYPWQGLLRTNWPSFKYGASIRGQTLEIELDPDQSYDRVRLFTTRHFNGELVRYEGRKPIAIKTIDVPHAMFWHGKLDTVYTDSQIELHRQDGIMGQIDFYRSRPLRDEPASVDAYYFTQVDDLPESATGKLIKTETPRRFWQPVGAKIAGGDAWALQSPAFGGFQAITDPPAEAQGYTGAVVEIVVSGITEPTPVRIAVKEPVDSERVWLAADVVLEPKGIGKQSYKVMMTGRPVINIPPNKTKKYIKDGKYSETDLIDMPGMGFGLTVEAANPMTWHMGSGGSALKLITTDKAAIVARAADDQVEFMREAYAERMEGHLYGDPRIITPLTWLAMFAPDRMEFRQLWERIDHRAPQIVGIDIPKLVMPERVNDAGAPDWAFWQMQAMREHVEHLHWMIDEKQIWTGEFGGLWNDDSTHIENWMGYMLCMDDDRKISNAIHKYWEGLWNYQLIDGVGKNAQDSSHYSEEGTSNLGQRLLIDFGDPIAYARTMLAAKRTQYWVKDDGNGGLMFKGDYLGPWGVWTEGAFAYNVEQGKNYKIPLAPHGYLIWYNRHPKSADYLTRIADGGKGNNAFLGVARGLANDVEGQMQFYRDVVAKKPGRYGPGREGHTDSANWFSLPDDVRELQKEEYKPQPAIMHYWGSKNTEYHYWNWKVTGDIRYLIDSYKRVTEWFYSHDWLNSAAMPSLDRSPLPRGSLIRSRIGATPANRGSSANMWPLHAISFTRGANDVASLVTENLPNQLAVRFWAFTEDSHDVGLRVWRCNGTFNVTLSHDKDNDGKPESAIWSKKMSLDRGAPIDITIPAKQGVILVVTPIETQPENFDRADPAISLGSIELLYGDHLVVNVYNNGTQPVDDVVVRVRDKRTGHVVINGEQRTGPIEAPLDLTPRFKMVEFKNINCNAWDTIVIEIDPDNLIDDFNRHNNRVEMKFQATFRLHEGWR